MDDLESTLDGKSKMEKERSFAMHYSEAYAEAITQLLQTFGPNITEDLINQYDHRNKQDPAQFITAKNIAGYFNEPGKYIDGESIFSHIISFPDYVNIIKDHLEQRKVKIVNDLRHPTEQMQTTIAGYVMRNLGVEFGPEEVIYRRISKLKEHSQSPEEQQRKRAQAIETFELNEWSGTEKSLLIDCIIENLTPHRNSLQAKKAANLFLERDPNSTRTPEAIKAHLYYNWEAYSAVIEGEYGIKLTKVEKVNFTDTMTQELIRFRNEGTPTEEIAKRLNITFNTVEYQIRQLIKEGILEKFPRDLIEKQKKSTREITLDTEQINDLSNSLASLVLDTEDFKTIDRTQLVTIAHEFASKNPQYKANQILNFIINNRKLLGNEITILNQQTLTDSEKLLIDNLINAGIPVLEISKRLIRSKTTIGAYINSKPEA